MLWSLFITASVASALTIGEINGNKFLSPYNGQSVANISGLVTAKGPDGIWIRSTTPDHDPRSSESVYVFGSSFGKNLTVGDVIVFGGKVQEYRSSKDYLYLTEISSPRLVRIISQANTVEPLVIGKDTLNPPTEHFSSLDKGDVFGIPNNVSLVSVTNPELEPGKFGLDFWESLSGELVTVRRPKAIAKPNNFGDTWVVGDWKVTGRNERGGLTMTERDANPEVIIIGDPLDGTDNPITTRLGDDLEDITGVITYAFGFYRILPTTAIKVTGSAKPSLPSTTDIKSSGNCEGITFGAYNIENLSPNSTHVRDIASHIVSYLKSPDIIFLQEVQDNNGPTNDNVVSANLTLTTLIKAISAAGGPSYAFTDIDPVDDQDGGQPGGNIRPAYLYKVDVVRLYKPNIGSSTDANAVLPGPSLKYNPGRIDPTNVAWTASRKPLVAAWEAISKGDGGQKSSVFFTVNVHFASKGGSSSIQGDARPPVNGGVSDRLAQAELTAQFIEKILTEDQQARIITAGDFNEFTFAQPLQKFQEISGLKDLDGVVKIAETERYTYLFDMNAQQLDHMFVSQALARQAKYEHIHINSWVDSASQISDHDPSVAKLDVCS